MRKYFFPTKDDKYSITECSRCGVVVHCETIKENEKYPAQRFYIDPHVFRYLAFQPNYRFSPIEAGPIGQCKCKTIPTDEIKTFCNTLNEKISELKGEVSFIRRMCPHEKWWLIGKGDYRHSAVWKVCATCGRFLNAPTQEEIENFLKEHPGYEYKDGYISYRNDSEPYPVTINMGDPDEDEEL